MKLVSFLYNGQESFGVLGNSGLHPVLEAFKKECPDLKAVFGSQKIKNLKTFCEEKPIPLSQVNCSHLFPTLVKLSVLV